jgi:hypothetical protein
MQTSRNIRCSGKLFVENEQDVNGAAGGRASAFCSPPDDPLQLCLAGGDTRGSRRMIITELNLLVVEDAWKNWMLGVSTAPVGLCADVVGAS